MSSDWRDLNHDERAILDRLLANPFPGRDEIRHQIASCRVRSIDGYEAGDLSLEFQINSERKAPVRERIPVEAAYLSDDGNSVMLLYLHVIDGRLDQFEVSDFFDPPLSHLPPPSALKVHVWDDADP